MFSLADGVNEAEADTDRLKNRMQRYCNVSTDQYLKV